MAVPPFDPFAFPELNDLLTGEGKHSERKHPQQATAEDDALFSLHPAHSIRQREHEPSSPDVAGQPTAVMELATSIEGKGASPDSPRSLAFHHTNVVPEALEKTSVMATPQMSASTSPSPKEEPGTETSHPASAAHGAAQPRLPPPPPEASSPFSVLGSPSPDLHRRESSNDVATVTDTADAATVADVADVADAADAAFAAGAAFDVDAADHSINAAPPFLQTQRLHASSLRPPPHALSSAVSDTKASHTDTGLLGSSLGLGRLLRPLSYSGLAHVAAAAAVPNTVNTFYLNSSRHQQSRSMHQFCLREALQPGPAWRLPPSLAATMAHASGAAATNAAAHRQRRPHLAVSLPHARLGPEAEAEAEAANSTPPVTAAPTWSSAASRPLPPKDLFAPGEVARTVATVYAETRPPLLRTAAHTALVPTDEYGSQLMDPLLSGASWHAQSTAGVAPADLRGVISILRPFDAGTLLPPPGPTLLPDIEEADLRSLQGRQDTANADLYLLQTVRRLAEAVRASFSDRQLADGENSQRGYDDDNDTLSNPKHKDADPAATGSRVDHKGHAAVTGSFRSVTYAAPQIMAVPSAVAAPLSASTDNFTASAWHSAPIVAATEAERQRITAALHKLDEFQDMMRGLEARSKLWRERGGRPPLATPALNEMLVAINDLQDGGGRGTKTNGREGHDDLRNNAAACRRSSGHDSDADDDEGAEAVLRTLRRSSAAQALQQRVRRRSQASSVKSGPGTNSSPTSVSSPRDSLSGSQRAVLPPIRGEEDGSSGDGAQATHTDHWSTLFEKAVAADAAARRGRDRDIVAVLHQSLRDDVEEAFCQLQSLLLELINVKLTVAVDDFALSLDRKRSHLLHQQLGHIYYVVGNMQEAAHHCSEAIALAPREVEARWTRHLALRAMGEDDGALETLDELAGFAADFRVHRAQGDIYFEKTAWREAAGAYASALLYNGRDVHCIFRQGLAEESSGQPQAAMQAFLLVLELDPGHRQARRRHADLSLHRGSARPAIRGYTSLLSEAPGDASLYFQRAQARMHNRDLMAALHDLTQCIHLDPTHAGAYYVRATLLVSTNPIRALRDFSTVLLLEDEDSDITTRVYLQRGIVYAASKKAALALADLRACLKQAPPPAAHSVETLYQMGLVHLRLLGRLARAITLFTQALQVDPTCSRALLARAAAYLELDRGDVRAITKAGKRQAHGGDLMTEEQAAAAAAAAHVAREALPLLDGNAVSANTCEDQGGSDADGRLGTASSASAAPLPVGTTPVGTTKRGPLLSTATGLAAHLRLQPLPPAPHPRHGLELASRLESSQGMAERAAAAASEAATAAAVLLPRTRPTRTPLRRALRDCIRLIHLDPLCVEYRLLGGRTALTLGESNLAQQMLSAARAIAGAPLGRHPLVQMQADVQLGKTDVAIETLCRRLWPVAASDPAAAGALRAVRQPGSLLARLRLAATPGRGQAELMARDRFLQPLVMALVAARRFEEAVAVLEVVVGAGQATADTLMAMGECCTAMGDEMLAAEVLTSALRQLPRLAQAWYRRGVARLRLGQARSAAHDLAKAVELEPTLWQAMLSRATLFALQRRFPKAILNCNEALRLQPRSVRALLMRGCLKALNGTLERALVDLEAAAELDDSRSALITFNRGLVLHRLGRFHEALADYDETLARSATFAPVVRLNRALAHMSLKDFNAAFSDLRALLEVTSSLAPGDEGGRGLAGPSSAVKAARSATPPPTHVLHTMALCCHRGGDVRGAVELYCRALDLDPQFVAGYVGRGNALLDIGTERCWTLCRRDFTRALRCDPLRSDAYLNLGIGLQARGQLRRAHRVLSQGIALFPDHAALREARGVVNLQALDVRAAYLDLSAAVHAPEGATATALNTRGVVQLYMHDSVAAMQDFQAAIAADPKDSLPLFNAANVYMAKRQLRQALANYDMAIDLAGGVGAARLDPSWLVNRALCKAAQGRLQQALADLHLAAQRMGVTLPGNGGSSAVVAEDADLGSGRATEAAKDDVLWNAAVLQLRLAATARKGWNGLAEGLPDVFPRPPTTAEHEASLSAMQAAWRALEIYCGRQPLDKQAEHQRVLAKAEVEAQQQRSEDGGV